MFLFGGQNRDKSEDFNILWFLYGCPCLVVLSANIVNYVGMMLGGVVLLRNNKEKYGDNEKSSEKFC